MRPAIMMVVPTLLLVSLLVVVALLPVAYGFGFGFGERSSSRRHHSRPRQRCVTTTTTTPTSTLRAFHHTRLFAAPMASAGESEAAGSSSSSESSPSSSLPSTLPSLKILQENQKYFDDNDNNDNDDDDDINSKEWAVMIKKTTTDDMEKSTVIDDYNNDSGSSSVGENERDGEMSDLDITNETTDITNIITDDTGDDDTDDDDEEMDNPDWNDNEQFPLVDNDNDDGEDEIDDIANMLMECPPTLRQVVRGEAGEGDEAQEDSGKVLLRLPRLPPLPPPSLSSSKDEDEASQSLLVEEEEILMKAEGNDSEVGVVVEEEPSLSKEENDNSESSTNNLVAMTESSQASLSRTYSIDEAYKIFKGGNADNIIVLNDVFTGGVDHADDNDDAGTISPDVEYERRLTEANELIATLGEREMKMELELNDGKSQLNDALEAKERALAEANELIASLKNQESIMERELNNGKIQLNEALEAKQREIAEANELIASLKNQEAILERELNDGKIKFEEVLEGKERVAAEYSYAVNKYIDLKDSMASIVANQTNQFINDQNINTNAKVEEEKARGKLNLQRLSDEYEGMLSKKSRKIFELRQALRSANDRKRRLERQLRLGSKENESELRVGRKERERLMAEVTLLTKSFGDVQAELATNAKMYNDCIESYEREAAEKDLRIRDIEEKLRVANEKIIQLESQIVELTFELEKERIVNANLTSVVSELQSELAVASTNADGYDDIIAILRRESETYQSQLAIAQNDSQLYKQKTIDLETLLSKTKDSLVSEKKRVMDAMEAKDKQIAQLDRDLAEKLKDVRASQATIEKTTKQLQQMTNKYNTEKDRADVLDKKIERLNQLTAANEAATTIGSSEEVDRLTKLMEEITKSNDEYKSIVSAYDDKVKFLSRQLLLSGQNVSNKQSQIECLRRDLIAATSEARVVAEDQTSASEEVSNLRAKLADVQSKSTMWKAQANGMIIQLTNDLREKDAAMLELQNKLDKLSEEKTETDQQQVQQPIIKEGARDEEIAQLRSAMEEAQLKAKERMKQKNQSLKEMEDMVTTLTSEIEDLKREKEKLNDRLAEDNERIKYDYEVHDRQLRQTEDRLTKEHLAAMTELENEMNRTVRQLEMQIESLKSNAATGSSTGQGVTSVKKAQQDFLKVQEMEEALRRSKEMEVSLINQNMKMKQKLQDLQQQVKERTDVALNDDDDDEIDDDDMPEKSLPTYYRERQRPQVIQLVGNAWKKLFRRKKLL